MGSGTHISRQIKSTTTADRHRSAAPNDGSGRAAPPNGCTSNGGSTQASGSEVLSSNPEYRQYGEDLGVPGGQLTLDLIAENNQDFPNNQVSLADLKPDSDPDLQCRGSVPLKNGFLTCGCFVRAKAPDPITHRDVPGFDGMSNKGLRRFIIKRYMKSGFNNCRIHPLKMMYTDRPLELFVDPSVKPVTIHKAASIPIQLKARLKRDLD